MRLFLDTSVLLAASGSEKGASRFVVEHAGDFGWKLVSSSYCEEETRRNLPKIGDAATRYFERMLRRKIEWSVDILTSEQVVVFPKAKDRPVLLSAMAAESAVLLTLDRADFHERLGRQFYGMAIRTPGEWLMERREAGEV